MIIGVGIIIGLLFAFFVFRMGFYETWILLLNLVISAYLAIFLGLMLVDMETFSKINSYGIVFAIAVGCFLILQVTSYFLFTCQFRIEFPKLFDKFGAAFLGFLAGFLVWSFACTLIVLSPISQNSLLIKLGIGNTKQQAGVGYVSWWCDMVNSVVSSKSNDLTTAEAIDELRTNTLAKRQKRKTKEGIEGFEPAAGPNEMKPEEFPGPPPDADIEDI